MSGTATRGPVIGAQAIMFGKYPAFGDFVSEGLDRRRREAWDGWFSAGLTAAKAALGEGWEEGHDAGAAWRFVCGPSALGPGWRLGGFAPSVDSVGRRFFLMLALDGLSRAHALALGFPAAERAVGYIYDIVANRMTTPDALDGLACLLEETDPALTVLTDAMMVETAAGLWWTVAPDGRLKLEAAALPGPGFIGRALSVGDAT